MVPWLAPLLLCVARASVDVAPPVTTGADGALVVVPGAPTPPVIVTFLDGGTPRAAIRLDEVRDATWPRGATGAVTYADPGSGRAQRAFVDDTAVVRFLPGTDVQAAARARDLLVVRPLLPSIGAWLVRDVLGRGDGLDLAARLAPDALDGRVVVDAMPNLFLARALKKSAVPPDDPRYAGQNYLERIRIEAAWELSTGDPDVAIAIVDDGCDLAHDDLYAKFLPGRDIVDQDDEPLYVPDLQGNEHGTACAGLAAASTDNGVGMAGACPDCSLRCMRFIPPDGLSPISADLDVIAVQLEMGVAVSSNSWGYRVATPVPDVIRAGYEDLADNGRGGKGTVVVFAAGNDNRLLGDDEIENIRGVLTVGAVTNFEETAQFSNGGGALDVTAPLGTFTTDITGAQGVDPGDYFSSFGGTSSSAPIVSGIAGLIIAADPDATSAEVIDLLTATAQQSNFATPDDRGHDLYYGYGVVRPEVALQRLLGLDDPPPVEDDTAEVPPWCAHAGAPDRGPSAAIGLAALLFGGALVARRRRRVMRRGRRSSAA